MAEPVLSPSHPLAQYLSESVDPPTLPGHLTWPTSAQPHPQHPLARLALHRLEPLLALLLPYLSARAPQHALAERLKFLVISSPLLTKHLPSPGPSPGTAAGQSAPSLPPSPRSHPALPSPTTPGLTPPGRLPAPSIPQDAPSPGEGGLGALWLLAILSALLALLLRSPTLFLLLQSSLFLAGHILAPSDSEADGGERGREMQGVLEGVQALVAAAEQWDTAVGSGLELLEADEHFSLPHSLPSSPTQPTAALREHLRGALHEAAQRASSVRACLAPLASSSALRQLGEMYAPPRAQPDPDPSTSTSASTSTFAGNMSTASSSTVGSPRRVLSLSASPAHGQTQAQAHRRPQSMHLARSKRARPSLSGIGLAPSFSLPVGLRERALPPAQQQQQQQQQQRTPLTSPRSGREFAPLPQTPEDALASFSPPPSHAHAATAPFTPPHVLPRPRSDNHLRGSSSTFHTPPLPRAPATVGPAASVFSKNALSLEHSPSPSPLPSRPEFPPGSTPRSIRRARSHTLSLSVHPSPGSLPSSPTPLRGPHQAQRPSIAQRLRAPLSLASLSSDLSTALHARRWAAAHLLALRFSGDDLARSPGALGAHPAERDQYWEDVRDVVSTWARALEDIAAALRGAVEHAQRRLDDAARQPITPLPGSVFGHAQGAGPLASPLPLSATASSSSAFAPSLSPMGRFLDRTTTLLAALDDMRAQLAASTAALRMWTLRPPSSADEQEDGPLAVYDSMRPVLAAALREYERGRADLLAVVRKPPALAREGSAEADAEEAQVPPLSMDHSSASGSEERGSPPPPPPPSRPLRVLESVLARSHPPPQALDPDSHLPLPPLDPPFDFARPGIEHVFEHAGASAAFAREHSKLSREERIALARAQREARMTSGSTSGSGPGSASPAQAHMIGVGPGMTRERWGPPGDVVQELRDVILRVGQRRLALVDSQSQKQAADRHSPQQAATGIILPGGGTAPVTPPFSPPARMPVLETADE
ncbi:hypothetical protein CALCODRAFT_298761 [Calocera cornea HHB12733]|uniref:Uncharacterized protein n=1 Tax=Calocera cornea HHB12733 TaxID=1353952 RepID=A0A165FJH6_9BASI|nr:hypothetical protein CALCODRAFT_298761 [Calocera cornea HHB12733]